MRGDDDTRAGESEMEATIGSVIRLAGRRSLPAAERQARVRSHVHAAWRSAVRRRRLRSALLLAAASLAAAAVAVGPWLGRGEREREGAGLTPVREGIARLDAALGTVEASPAAGPEEWRALAPGDAIFADGWVRTTSGSRAGFRMRDGRSVRIDAGTQLRWTSGGLVLEAGAVYVDSGLNPVKRSALVVWTPWGSVREVGTQFEVRLKEAGVQVRVREGRIELTRGADRQQVAAGTELTVDASGPRRRDFATHGPEWGWVLAVAPVFDIEGGLLRPFLLWTARENGWKLKFADPESRRLAESTRLHGSVAGLDPAAALQVVMPTTGVPYRVEGGVLEIGIDDEAKVPAR